MSDRRPDSTSPPYGRDSDPERENRLVAAMEEYRAAVEAGESIDQQAFVKRFPDIADELADCLAGMEMIQGLAKQVQPVADGESMANEPSTPTLRSLGDYRIHQEIGRGGMGVVYEAQQISVGRRVALKVLPFAALLNERQLRRFNTEASAAARLQHSNIVPVYTLGCERGIHFYAMQLIDGPSLAEVIAELRHDSRSDESADVDDRPADTETVADVAANILTRDADGGGHYRAVARIGCEVAEALHYAHENGVLHRDIKPSNLLLDSSGHVWIADFGLARVEDESQLTRTGDILGTLRYMSPEQAAGERAKIDARSDVYSLGATLYELATLKPVFDSEDRRDVIKKVVAGNPIAPHKMDSRIPRPLSLIISKAMARRVDERYKSAQELANDLQRFLDGQPVQAKPPTLLRRARAWSRRHRFASAAIVGLLILCLLAPVTHHLNQRIPNDSQPKGNVMKPSKVAKVAAAVAAMAIVASSSNAKKPAKPTPPAPPIQYQLTLIDNFGAQFSAVRRVNNSGEAIGTVDQEGLGGFYYSKAVGQVFLSDLVEVPENWEIKNALDINDSRLIVGTMQNTTSLREAGFVIDLNVLSISFLEEPGPGNYYAQSINDLGDIVGVIEGNSPLVWSWDNELGMYKLQEIELPPVGVNCGFLNTFNNSGQILGNLNWLYTPGEGWEMLETFRLRGLNDFGNVVGTKGGRRDDYAVVYHSSNGVYEKVFDARKVNDVAEAINNTGDVALRSGTDGDGLYLIHKDNGLLKINDVVIGDSADVAYFLSEVTDFYHMSERNEETGYPVLVGDVLPQYANGEARGFLLTPVLPESN